MIYEKKTVELLADQRLLSRFNKKNTHSDINNDNIIKHVNNNYSLSKVNKYNNISKYMNYIILLIYIYGITGTV
jgi:hypothetical protein